MKKKERDTFCQESATNTAFKRGKGEKKETSSCFLSVVLERSSPPPFYSQSSVEFFREFILNIRTAFFINIPPPTRNQFGFFFCSFYFGDWDRMGRESLPLEITVKQ